MMDYANGRGYVARLPGLNKGHGDDIYLVVTPEDDLKPEIRVILLHAATIKDARYVCPSTRWRF